MSRTLHDTFAKDWFREFLTDFGLVETEYPISSEIRHVDVYFQPTGPSELFPIELTPMGLLSRMISGPCLIEPFRNAIPAQEICNCIAKASILGYKMLRDPLRSDLTNSDGAATPPPRAPFHFDDRPFLWMISPTLSKAMQAKFAPHQDPTWGPGFHFCQTGFRAAIITVHQLPVTLDTLWLRMLGKGRVQKQAFAELIALPLDHPYREMTLRHIATLQETLQTRQNKDQYLEEMVMTLVSAYDRMTAENQQKGKEEMQRTVALKLASRGFQPDEIASLVELSPDQVLMICDQTAVEQRQLVQAETRAIVLHMASQGTQPEAIASLTGLPLNTVQTVLQAQHPSES
jgi:hypothetical protein